MDRRVFLAAASVPALAVLAGCAQETTASPTRTPATTTSAPAPSSAPATPPTPTESAAPIASKPSIARVPLPPGAITGLPGTAKLLAWTVDDGTSSDVVAKYARFAAATGTRLTFFLNGKNPAWTVNAALLRPLVESGQIQLGNHTWDHPNLTHLSNAGILYELQRNHDFIKTTYGVDARPYFRPPFGFHDARVDGIAASIGYTTPVLWYGSLSDSGLITPDQVVEFATEWFLPEHIVIGHANYEPVTTVFRRLTAIIRERGLTTVTLDDVFAQP